MARTDSAMADAVTGNTTSTARARREERGAKGEGRRMLFIDRKRPMAVIGKYIPGLLTAPSFSIAAGQVVTLISTDATMASASNANVPTQLAVKTYIDANASTSTSVSVTFTGPWASGQTVTVWFTKFGNAVWCAIPAVSAAQTVGTFASSGAADVPAGYRPTTTPQYQNWMVLNASSYIRAHISVTSAGLLAIYASCDNANFSGGGTCGWRGQMFTWSTN